VNYVQEANGIFSIYLLESDICRSIVDSVKRATEWQVAEVGSELEENIVSVVDSDFRSANVLFSADAPVECAAIDSRFEDMLPPLVKDIWDLELSDREGTQIVRYGNHGHYNAHADAALDLQQRYFTALCYLNDDFEGGQTTFPYLKNFSVSPRAGKLVVFPSRYVHRAEPVSKGEKYVAVTWLHGPVPIKWL
jgi:Rps23 Pro-64 3,4-dihydroxylase Tpa1-like proline 4-hydroxylase